MAESCNLNVAPLFTPIVLTEQPKRVNFMPCSWLNLYFTDLIGMATIDVFWPRANEMRKGKASGVQIIRLHAWWQGTS